MSHLFELPQHHVFFLCPDREFARGLRRHLVNSCGVVFGQAGTFDELLEIAHKKRLLDLYAIPHPEVTMESIVGSDSSAFWAASFQHDKAGVCSTLAQSLETLVFGLGDISGPYQQGDEQLGSNWAAYSSSPRVQQRLSQLQRLLEVCYSMHCLPQRLQKLLEILRCQHAPITPIKVLASRHLELTGPAVDQLLHTLDNDCQGAVHQATEIVQYSQSMSAFDDMVSAPNAKPGSNLYLVQRSIFKASHKQESTWATNDRSVQWVQCRDRIESFELLAGMIQHEIQQGQSSGQGLQQSDYAVLLPEAFDCHAQLVQVLTRAGLGVSNLDYTRSERNLAGELLRYALRVFAGAAPKLAVKSLVTNPLMPWPASIGNELAGSIDRYGFSIKKTQGCTKKHEALITLFNEGVARQDLESALIQLQAALNRDGQSEAQLENLDRLFAQTIQHAKDHALSYEALMDTVSLSPIEVTVRTPVNLDGITLVPEGQHPWRAFQYLYVLDFNSGSFPSVVVNPVVFSDTEWGELAHGIPALALQRSRRVQAKAMFRSQMSQASERVTLFIPSFDGLGNPLKPSESLIDFAALAGQLDEPHALLLDVTNEQDRSSILGLQYTCEKVQWTPRLVFESTDLEFNQDLLARWTKSVKNPDTGEYEAVIKPQSPSALDDLLICPLGWLIKQLGADPQVWEPDGFTPITSGVIAHDVLEALFTGEDTVPDANSIEAKAQGFFDEAIRKKAPYLSAVIWQVERNNLLALIKKAALAWSELLIKLNARVVAPELWLQGTFDGHPIHGQTDCVLALPDQGVLVVDFKTAKADKYAKRMKGQVDLQASLYEQMLKTGGLKKPEDAERAKNANLKKLNGVLYFTLKDQVATSNFKPSYPPAGWNTVSVGDESSGGGSSGQDVSSRAMAWLTSRFNELRSGRVVMVKESEIKEYDKLGFGSYIFSVSPLVERSIIQDLAPTQDEEEDE